MKNFALTNSRELERLLEIRSKGDLLPVRPLVRYDWGMNKAEKTKKIISDILYITLATSSKDGEPWNTPVYGSYDESYNFFWISSPESKHSKNIKENNQVAIVIYNSTDPEGTGEGVYIQAKAYELTDLDEIEKALKFHYGRKNKPARPISDFQDYSPRRVYKAIPEKFWINETQKVNGYPADIRSEVDMK